MFLGKYFLAKAKWACLKCGEIDAEKQWKPGMIQCECKFYGVLKFENLKLLI